MSIHSLKYLRAFIIPIVTMSVIHVKGIFSFGTVIIAFGVIPIVEAMTKPSDFNIPEERESAYTSNAYFDWVLYLVGLAHIITLLLFIHAMAEPITWYERLGLILSMGTQCGSIGINIAHELGHRKSRIERGFARLLLLTSLYMHFIVEHNRGHHTYVATEQDPATARLNEPVYLFWIRSMIFSFLSAWRIERNRLIKEGKHTLSLYNEMLWVIVIESSLVLSISFFLGPLVALSFIAAALLGMLLLETVNYIEHYGLKRKKRENGGYERVQPWHSWNSDFPLGRAVLFELTRHSDHHYKASRKYQILRHLDKSPQLPMGYPGAMLLTLIPPLWFRIINPRIPIENG